MTLHTWNKADASAAAFATCLAALADDDTLLLIEDGVYLVLDAAFLQRFAPGAPRLCVLAADLAARGISDRLSRTANVIGYKDFVAMSLQHQQVVNWI